MITESGLRGKLVLDGYYRGNNVYCSNFSEWTSDQFRNRWDDLSSVIDRLTIGLWSIVRHRLNDEPITSHPKRGHINLNL